MKNCYRCNILKNYDNFNKNKNRKDWLSYWCKQCNKEYLNIYYKDNKNYLNNCNKIYREKNHENYIKKQKEYSVNNKYKLKQYKKEYYINNKEKISKKNKIYREKNINKCSLYNKEYYKEYYKNNKIKLHDCRKKYYNNNKDKFYIYGKKYYNNNKEKIHKRLSINRLKNEAYKKYAYEHRKNYYKWKWKEIILFHMRKRRAIKKWATLDSSIDMQSIKNLLIKQNYKCAISWQDLNITWYHVDHIIPLSKGWSHILSNIQLLTPKINLQKSNKLNFNYLTQ